MRELQTSSPALLELPEIRATAKRGTPVAVQTCLVVSASAWRAQLLVRAAHEEHWATIVCNSADDALRQAVRQRVQLALVDLQSAPAARVSELKKLVEQLAARRMLLAVCGKPDDTTGEVWSRQLGVWMYLPGVDSQSDIALLCAEARHVLEKLGGRSMAVGT
jgi:ActR/RegA family two-component response regulator